MHAFRILGGRFSAALLLLMLPVFVLLMTGFYLLRNERNAVETEAREGAEAGARAFLASFVRASTNYNLEAYLALTIEWPAGTLFFQISTNQELIYPPRIDQPVRPVAFAANLSTAQSNLWITAERDEYQKNDFAAALHCWDELLLTQLPLETEAAARFSRAVLRERSGDTNGASNDFKSLLYVGPDRRLESGLPVPPLAALKLLQRATSPLDHEAEVLATGCISNLLTHPTQFTPELLRAGRSTLAAAQFEKAERCWIQHEQARALYGAMLPQLASASTAFVSSVSSDSINWSIVRSETNFHARSSATLQELAAGLWKEGPAVPSYVSVILKSGDSSLFASSEKPVSEDRLWASVTDPSAPELRCNAYLEDESVLFARQRARARVFGGLLAAAAVCAGIGVFHGQRSLRKQQRLSEMKSNFVSSVSHELRAPLGSIRLISEALQSGRVVDPEKQREYFNFLVEESRRLSGLIENVLEFSRIEQNRRAFNFETVDLRDICAAAARSVAPIAAEHGVNLDASGADRSDACEVSGDALALQRSIVNLLDNAIKHSPAGERVTLTLTPAADHYTISVHDNGPGIPAAEHKRIFERFYRLGSELRRETPGVGIGLSIVQHTIQAHGGSIHLESSPAHGAIFTIRLPHAS